MTPDKDGGAVAARRATKGGDARVRSGDAWGRARGGYKQGPVAALWLPEARWARE